jgi:sugar lactone lactonase YvrE
VITNVVDVVVQGTDALGECPLWNDREGALYWVDSRAPAVCRWRPGGAREHWPMPELVGSIAFREAGGLLVALQSGVYRFDLDSHAIAPVFTPAAELSTNRFNDGRCDRRGRFWVGTMSDVSREPLGSLYRLAPDGASQPVFGDVIVPNSLGWSPDDTRMYFADTYRQVIYRFDFDAGEGVLSNRQVFSDLTGSPGRPDGSAVDADGCLWNCEYAGGRVVRYTPDGRVDRVVTMPVANPTCCAFGGPDLRTLYITTARQRLSPEQLSAQPLAGSVFAIDAGVSGLPEARFGG